MWSFERNMFLEFVFMRFPKLSVMLVVSAMFTMFAGLNQAASAADSAALGHSMKAPYHGGKSHHKAASAEVKRSPKQTVADKGALTGAWQVVSVLGQSAQIGMRGGFPEMQFSVDKVNGQSGCNGFGGAMQQGAGKVKFGAVVATQMACPEPMMKQEINIYAAMEAAETYKFSALPAMNQSGKHESAVRRLTFLNAKGAAVLVLDSK